MMKTFENYIKRNEFELFEKRLKEYMYATKYSFNYLKHDYFEILDKTGTYFDINDFQDFSVFLDLFFKETESCKDIKISKGLENIENIKKEYNKLYYFLIDFIKKYYLEEYNSYIKLTKAKEFNI